MTEPRPPHLRTATAYFRCGAEAVYEYDPAAPWERELIVRDIASRDCPACAAGIGRRAEAISPDTLPPDVIVAGGTLLIGRPERRGFKERGN